MCKVHSGNRSVAGASRRPGRKKNISRVDILYRKIQAPKCANIPCILPFMALTFERVCKPDLAVSFVALLPLTKKEMAAREYLYVKSVASVAQVCIGVCRCAKEMVAYDVTRFTHLVTSH
jgi:hypothetical protein